VTDKVMAPEQMARLFHDAYERLAPQFGYETRKDTRAFDPSTPNGKLMIATCAEVLAAAPSPAPVAKIEEPMDEPRREDYALDSLYFDDLRRYIDSLRAALVESENRACHHGWRGTVPDEGRSIQTPCPACGARSLFIGSGGHLTCSRVPSDRSDGCHSPSVANTVKQLKQRAEQAESALAAAKEKVERETIERCCKAVCHYCEQGDLLRPHDGVGHVHLIYFGDPPLVSYQPCQAEAIRCVMSEQKEGI
jgi:HPt (histidine-containing phosphotransfer) domain-containing protein